MERLAPAAETMGQQWQFNFQKAERSKKWKQKRNELTLCWRPSPAFLRFFPTWFRFCLPPAGLPPAGRGKITDADHGSPITAAMETIEKRNKKNKKRPAKAPITSNDKRNAHTISLLTRNTRRTHTHTHTHTCIWSIRNNKRHCQSSNLRAGWKITPGMANPKRELGSRSCHLRVRPLIRADLVN